MKISAKPGLTSRDISLAYDEFFKQKGLLRDSDTYYRWVLSKISFRPGQRVLDVACGEGLLVKFAREQGLIAVGIDLSLQGTILAREFVNDTIITQANGEELPFASESFDIVTNLGSLEHFQDAETGLKEMIRVLRPGGQAVREGDERRHLHGDQSRHVWHRRVYADPQSAGGCYPRRRAHRRKACAP